MRTFFQVSHSKIAVLGLNSHSGEQGLLGEEENREILPAIARAREKGWQVDGPFPADSFFDLHGSSVYDAVIAMYLDQGLIPMKRVDFKTSVNFTLGLPFIRTSVSHGTAYDIAGKGVADPSNLLRVLEITAHLSMSKGE